MIWKWTALCAYVITQSRRTVYTMICIICRLYLAADDIDRFLRHSTCHHCHHVFCSNDSRTLSALRATVFERFTADAILIRKNSYVTRRIHRGKGGGVREAGKNWGLRGPLLPFPDYVGHAGYVVKATFKCSTLSTKSCGDHWHCIKTQTFATVFRHHCSSPDIYRFGQKWFKVVIKNFRDS